MDIDREQISYIIGQRIYTFRTQKKLSQEALAFESEIHPAYLGRVERGEKCPTIETLYKISKGLKIPLHELLDVSIEVKPTISTESKRQCSAFQKKNRLRLLKS